MLHRAREAEINSFPPTQPASALPEQQAPSGPFDGVTNVMCLATIPLPQISMYDVDSLIRACVRPNFEDPSRMELYLHMMPPLWLPTTLHLLREAGQLTPEERTHIPAAVWENHSYYLRNGAAHLVAAAERLTLADRGPSDEDLDRAPYADCWVPGHHGFFGLCLAGLLSGDADGQPGKPFSSVLEAIDLDHGWALTKYGWYRLGRRISGWEFQELHPTRRFAGFQEYGDEEMVYTLQADRARLAWRLGQLRLPPA